MTKNEPRLQYMRGNCGISMQTSKIGWSEIPANGYIRLSGEQGAGGQRRVHGCLFGNTYGNAFPPLVLLPLEGDAQGLEVP